MQHNLRTQWSVGRKHLSLGAGHIFTIYGTESERKGRTRVVNRRCVKLDTIGCASEKQYTPIHSWNVIYILKIFISRRFDNAKGLHVYSWRIFDNCAAEMVPNCKSLSNILLTTQQSIIEQTISNIRRCIIRRFCFAFGSYSIHILSLFSSTIISWQWKQCIHVYIWIA